LVLLSFGLEAVRALPSLQVVALGVVYFQVVEEWVAGSLELEELVPQFLELEEWALQFQVVEEWVPRFLEPEALVAPFQVLWELRVLVDVSMVSRGLEMSRSLPLQEV